MIHPNITRNYLSNFYTKQKFWSSAKIDKKTSIGDTESVKGNTGLVIVVIASVILLIGGFVFYTKRQNQFEPAVEMKQVDMSEGKNMMVEKDESMMMNKDEVLNVMSDPDSLTSVLTDVSGGTGTGTAYVLRRDETLWHALSANLPNPTPDTVYEGWLVNKAPTLKFFSTGVLEKQADGAYSLSFMTDKLYEGYNFVVVTEETVVDATPETHILEGAVQ